MQGQTHDIRTHGYNFLVPIGRLNTQEDESDVSSLSLAVDWQLTIAKDTLIHDEGSPQPQIQAQHPPVGAAAIEAGIVPGANEQARPDPLPQPPPHLPQMRRNQPPPPTVAADPQPIEERDLDDDISDASDNNASDDETVEGLGGNTTEEAD